MAHVPKNSRLSLIERARNFYLFFVVETYCTAFLPGEEGADS